MNFIVFGVQVQLCRECINEISSEATNKSEACVKWLEKFAIFENGKLIGFSQEPVRVIA